MSNPINAVQQPFKLKHRDRVQSIYDVFSVCVQKGNHHEPAVSFPFGEAILPMIPCWKEDLLNLCLQASKWFAKGLMHKHAWWHT